MTDILIPRLKLSEGQNSNYRMNVDGMLGTGMLLGKEFENVELYWLETACLCL